jgi:uncharacterized protein (DUF608 family)
MRLTVIRLYPQNQGQRGEQQVEENFLFEHKSVLYFILWLNLPAVIGHHVRRGAVQSQYQLRYTESLMGKRLNSLSSQSSVRRECNTFATLNLG